MLRTGSTTTASTSSSSRANPALFALTNSTMRASGRAWRMSWITALSSTVSPIPTVFTSPIVFQPSGT